ncbi:hypothetical protein MMC10_005320 [Thelotrema lepadinum]|nr:hypothetical protein [Thelotrema lepadinum]
MASSLSRLGSGTRHDTRARGGGSIELQNLNAESAFNSASGDLSLDDGSVSGQDSSTQLQEKNTFTLPTPEEEAAVLKKLDRHLVLFLALLYMLSFLDRSNIGNAKIAGLTDDLRLDSSEYEWVLTAFYITYILFEWMTLLYRIIPPHIYISICVAGWGLVASLQSFATSFAALLILRALLGVSEAAFGPGVPFYLSFFFNREELAFRTGLFISAAPLATSFASSLAWLILKAGNSVPISNWRLLFLLEGFPSVIIAFFAWYYIPDSPSQAKFLDEREKEVAVFRLNNGAKAKDSGRQTGLQWGEVLKTLTDPKSYLTALMFFSCNVAFSSLPPFLPQVIKEMSYSPLTSQALSAPPYLFSFGIVILTARLSDRARLRSPYVIFHAALGSAGYFWLALSGYLQLPPFARYLGVFGAAAGFFSAVTLVITWTMDNRRAAEGKGTGVVIMNIVGQLGPLVGTHLYPDDDAPYYVKGMLICGIFMSTVGVLAWILRRILRRENEAARESVAYQRIVADDEVRLDNNHESEARTVTKTGFINIL